MGRRWTAEDEMRFELASEHASDSDPPVSPPPEPLQSKDLLFRDVFRGSLAYFLTALRFRLRLAAITDTYLRKIAPQEVIDTMQERKWSL